MQLMSPLTALKIILIYVQGCEKRKPKHIITDWMKNKLENLSFINLDRYQFVELPSSHEIQTTLSLDRCQLSSFNEKHFSHLILRQTCMTLTLELETLFLEVLNISQMYPNTSKVRFVKGLANYIKQRHMFQHVKHICPNNLPLPQ